MEDSLTSRLSIDDPEIENVRRYVAVIENMKDEFKSTGMLNSALYLESTRLYASAPLEIQNNLLDKHHEELVRLTSPSYTPGEDNEADLELEIEYAAVTRMYGAIEHFKEGVGKD